MQSVAKKKGFFSQVLRGIFVGLIVILIGVIIFSLVVKYAYLQGTVIKAVNQFIKVLGVFLGCFISFKYDLGWLKGLTCGVGIGLISTLFFALIGCPINFNYKFILDLLFLAVVGTILGVISVNVKKEK